MSSSIKIESKVYILEGVETKRIDSLTRYVSSADVRTIEQIKLSTTNLEKVLADTYLYFRLSSNYPVKIKIVGETEIVSDFVEIGFSSGKVLRLIYENPGLDEDIIITFIGIKP